MNTSKNLDSILEDVFMVGVQHESKTVPEIEKLLAKSRAAIVEAVEGLIGENEPEPTRYGKRIPVAKNAIAFQKYYRNKFRAELRQAIKEWQ